MAETQQQWQYSVLYTPSKSNTNYSSQFSISLSLSLSLLPSIIYTHFTHIMAKNTTAMATLHIITEKILLCTPLLSLLTKCLIDSNKILIINIFAIKQRVNRKKISVIIFCVRLNNAGKYCDITLKIMVMLQNVCENGVRILEEEKHHQLRMFVIL